MDGTARLTVKTVRTDGRYDAVGRDLEQVGRIGVRILRKSIGDGLAFRVDCREARDLAPYVFADDATAESRRIGRLVDVVDIDLDRAEAVFVPWILDVDLQFIPLQAVRRMQQGIACSRFEIDGRVQPHSAVLCKVEPAVRVGVRTGVKVVFEARVFRLVRIKPLQGAYNRSAAEVLVDHPAVRPAVAPHADRRRIILLEGIDGKALGGSDLQAPLRILDELQREVRPLGRAGHDIGSVPRQENQVVDRILEVGELARQGVDACAVICPAGGRVVLERAVFGMIDDDLDGEVVVVRAIDDVLVAELHAVGAVLEGCLFFPVEDAVIDVGPEDFRSFVDIRDIDRERLIDEGKDFARYRIDGRCSCRDLEWPCAFVVQSCLVGDVDVAGFAYGESRVPADVDSDLMVEYRSGLKAVTVPRVVFVSEFSATDPPHCHLRSWTFSTMFVR